MKKNPALAVLCTASFLVPFMGSAINLSLPQIGETFSMKAVSLTWIATAYLMATAVFQVPFARLADLVGRKKVFISGISLFSITTFLCGFAPSGQILIAFRAFSGLGCAMMFGTSMAILTAVFPPQERGKAIGVSTSVVYLALASGPFIGGLLTHYWGWQSLFYLTGILGLFVITGAFIFLKGEWIEAKGEKFDYIGSIIFAIGLFGLIFGFSKLPDDLAWLWIAAGVIAFALFVLYELKEKQPVFNVRIFSGNKTFGLSSFSALINYTCTSAIAFMMSLYLQYVREFDAHNAGLILIVQACVQCLVSLYAGKLSDKFNPALLATSGMGIIVIGLVGLIFISPSTSLVFIVFLLSLLGLGFGLFSSPNANIIMSSVDKKYYGQASATIGTMRLTGQAFSMGIAMMALSLYLGNRIFVPELQPLFMRSFHVTFGICAVLCIIGTYASSFRTKKEKYR
ncbi:MAG: MFS transporter [Candidatus Symbiothrix sp.]|jgi:EmrB/QacA subfamily drug resistance transporter|nr:MFS transporter [Candidatus Symbiothrix sp.]